MYHGKKDGSDFLIIINSCSYISLCMVYSRFIINIQDVEQKSNKNLIKKYNL